MIVDHLDIHDSGITFAINAFLAEKGLKRTAWLPIRNSNLEAITPNYSSLFVAFPVREGYHTIFIGEGIHKRADQAKAIFDHVSKGVNGSDQVRGEFFGYPQCCIDAFIKEDNMNTRGELAENHFDYSLLQHVPCTEECGKSTQTLYEEVLRRERPELYEKFMRFAQENSDLF